MQLRVLPFTVTNTMTGPVRKTHESWKYKLKMIYLLTFNVAKKHLLTIWEYSKDLVLPKKSRSQWRSNEEGTPDLVSITKWTWNYNRCLEEAESHLLLTDWAFSPCVLCLEPIFVKTIDFSSTMVKLQDSAVHWKVQPGNAWARGLKTLVFLRVTNVAKKKETITTR